MNLKQFGHVCPFLQEKEETEEEEEEEEEEEMEEEEGVGIMTYIITHLNIDQEGV